MVVCGVLHAAALIGIVALAGVDSVRWSLIVLGVVAGVSLPPVSTSMRVHWGAIAGPDRTAAYSLVYLVQELSILAGPLLFAALTAAASSSVALAAVAALAGLGTVGFAASIGRHQSDRPTGRAAPHPPRAGAVLRPAGVRAALALGLLVGAVIGALEVAVPVLATAHGSPAAAGLLIAALSLGGIAGAIVYGRARWRAAPAVRLQVLLALMTLWLIVLVPANSLLLAAALLLLVGVPVNPVFATLSLLIDEHVPTGSVAEAFGWLSTAIAGGTGAASATAAALAGHHDPEAAFALAAAAGAAATAIAAVSTRRLRGRPSRVHT
jgi:predicted MFS family arabinose efflux permease